MSRLAWVGGVGWGLAAWWGCGWGLVAPPCFCWCAFPPPGLSGWRWPLALVPCLPWGGFALLSFLAGSFRAGLGLVRLVGPGGFGALWGGGVLALLSGIARSDGIW